MHMCIINTMAFVSACPSKNKTITADDDTAAFFDGVFAGRWMSSVGEPRGERSSAARWHRNGVVDGGPENLPKKKWRVK